VTLGGLSFQRATKVLGRNTFLLDRCCCRLPSARIAARAGGERCPAFAWSPFCRDAEAFFREKNDGSSTVSVGVLRDAEADHAVVADSLRRRRRRRARR